MIALRPVILLPFGNVEAETLATAGMILFIYGLEIPLRQIPYITIVGVFRSGGDTKCGLLYDLGCLWGIALPVTYIGCFLTELPLTMVFLIMLLAEDFIKSALCIRRLLSKKWIRPVTDEAARQTAGEGQADSTQA
jgi:Na+-driven multidrug efflux pump